MAHHVNGKNIILTAFNIDGYIPFACVQDVTINQDKDILVTSTPDSGTDRTYAYAGLRNTSITMRGITFLRDVTEGKKFAFDLFGSPTLVIRIVYTDTGGYTRSIDCTVIVPNISIDGTAGQLSHWNTTFQVSGPLTFDAAAPVPTTGEPFSAWLATTPDALSVTYAPLIGKTILEVGREDSGYYVTSAAPGNLEFKFTAGTGNILFQVPFNPGERVFVLWK